MHNHGARQTILSFLTMLFIGGGLYFLLLANNFTYSSYDIDSANNTELLINYFPIIEDRTLTENIEMSEEGEDYVYNNDYVIMPQGLPSFFVTMVVDGGTLIIDGNRRIRLAGIKAPDKDEEMGIEATDFLKNMIENKEVYFQIDLLNPQDDFGRLRGIIYLENINVNIEMLRSGFAHIYPINPSVVGPDEWVLFEREARESRRGLWGGEGYQNKFIEEINQENTGESKEGEMIVL